MRKLDCYFNYFPHVSKKEKGLKMTDAEITAVGEAIAKVIDSVFEYPGTIILIIVIVTFRKVISDFLGRAISMSFSYMGWKGHINAVPPKPQKAEKEFIGMRLCSIFL